MASSYNYLPEAVHQRYDGSNEQSHEAIDPKLISHI
jgi:hypothetical protein